MDIPLPHQVRAHGRRSLVVVAVVLVALVSLARPAGAVGVPVDPVPVGVWPLQPTPEVVRAFDPPDTTWGAGHRGVDLAGTMGQVVHAALAGRVTFAARLAGRGVVVVDHGSTRTTYEPVAATVRVGDVLARGQPIGMLELARSHCFPRACLHWGWRRGSTYLDPLLLVGGGPIVLLPLWRNPPTPSPSALAPPSSPVLAGQVPLPYADILARLRSGALVVGHPYPGSAEPDQIRPAYTAEVGNRGRMLFDPPTALVVDEVEHDELGSDGTMGVVDRDRDPVVAETDHVTSAVAGHVCP